LHQLQAQDEQQFGPGRYIPNVFIQYWSMRVMAYLAAFVFLLVLWGAWLLYRKKLEDSRWFLAIATWAVIAPFLMNTAGWLLTESGRQPWIVQGLMLTSAGVSPSTSVGEIVTSLVVYVLLYGALAVVEVTLMLRYARRGLPGKEPEEPPEEGGKPEERALALTY